MTIIAPLTDFELATLRLIAWAFWVAAVAAVLTLIDWLTTKSQGPLPESDLSKVRRDGGVK